MPRKAIIHVNHALHQMEHGQALKSGLERHGWQAEFVPANEPRPGDLVSIWGFKQPGVIEAARKAGTPVLVMERGHVQPRMIYTSMGFDGLAGRGRYPAIEDGGVRWQNHFGKLMQPWSQDGRVALVCGQVKGDAALYGVNFEKWAQEVTDALLRQGAWVVYRPHPLMLRHDQRWCPQGAEFSTHPLETDLARAAVCVTFNSTSGVEAALAGVPVIACDEGSMVRAVAVHDIAQPVIRPDRSAWAHRLAWCQWRLEEIADGTAWEAVSTCL